MSQYDSGMSAFDRLSASTSLTTHQSAVIRQTYMLFGLAVISAMAGGAIGASSETLARFFSSWMGWLVAIVALNAIPYIAMSVRHNPALGVLALFFDGFLSGIVLSPILFYASLVAPAMIVAALTVTGVVFVAITAFIFYSGRTFNAPRGMMFGIFAAIMAAILLNSFLNIGWVGVLISAGIGIMGVIALVSSTSGVLNSPDADSPVPGALALFAGVFNIFVAVLNILLRLGGGGRSDD
ncbi:MAG TPA: Bax inhibitor-1 family protein [Bryobacteraceae bacterium]|nr:Bax inhibitor-1 family protein [Bryobacteraceae bacterium]